jgi:hypothetical protein
MDEKHASRLVFTREIYMRAKKPWLLSGGAATLCLIALFILIGRPGDVGRSHFFKDQTYHFQTLRLLNNVPYGGSDTAEVLETIKHIRSGDAQGWYNAWSATAERTLALPSGPRTVKAEAELSCGPNPTFESRFFLPSSDTRRSIATQKNLSAFYKGLAALGVKYERMEAPYDNGYRLPMNYYPAEAQNRRNTLLVFHGGYDSTLEGTVLRPRQGRARPWVRRTNVQRSRARVGAHRAEAPFHV